MRYVTAYHTSTVRQVSLLFYCNKSETEELRNHGLQWQTLVQCVFGLHCKNIFKE